MKKIAIELIFIILILIILVNKCFADDSIKLTDANLNESLQKFIKSNSNNGAQSINVKDGVIDISMNEKNYKVNYDLNEKPMFTISTSIKKGMSYKEFKEEQEKLLLPMVGYIAVSNLKGAKIEDAGMYLMLCMLSTALYNNEKPKYVVSTEETLIQNNDGTATVIKESEFGNYVMEYVKSIYNETKQTFSDNNEGQYRTFSWSMEEKNVTENSCDLVSTLIVNTEADFSKLSEYFDNSIDTNKNELITTSNNDSEYSKTKIMPRTGEETNPSIIALYILIILSSIGIFSLVLTRRKKE